MELKGQPGKCQEGHKINDKWAYYNKAWQRGSVRGKLMERLTKRPFRNSNLVEHFVFFMYHEHHQEVTGKLS